MKQSSVEWLIEQIVNNNKIDKATFEKAIEMHKKEIIETHFNAQEFNAMMFHSAEEYYKSVFEKIFNK
jgi:hypothetical protein